MHPRRVDWAFLSTGMSSGIAGLCVDWETCSCHDIGIFLITDIQRGGLEEWCTFVYGLQDEKSTKLNSNLVSCQPDRGPMESFALPLGPYGNL